MSLETRLDAYESSRWYCPILIITARIFRDILLKFSSTKIIANYVIFSETGTQMVDWQTDMAKKIGSIFTYINERAKNTHVTL